MAQYTKIRDPKQQSRLARKRSIRKRIIGTTSKPRISVFRSAKHIYVQAIDDSSNKVLAASSDLDKTVRAQADGKNKKERARLVGQAFGKQLVAMQIKNVVFDRNGFIYHGRVKEVADGAREAGLEF